MRLFVFLDYDGTLAPIAPTPEKARMKREMRELLAWLSRSKKIRLAVISGRTLKDVKQKVGIPGIIYAGNHGMEIEDRGKITKIPVPKARILAAKRVALLAGKLFSGIKGVFIENKGMSFSVHYRMASDDDARFVKGQLFFIAEHYLSKGLVTLLKGRKVVEILPSVKWDKGKAILWLLKKHRFFRSGEASIPVYIGDDKTDETAFKALNGKGITIRVGKHGETEAQYRLKDVDEVKQYISRLGGLTGAC